MTKRYPEAELIELENQFSFASDDVYYYNAHRPASLVNRLKNRVAEFDPSVIDSIIDKSLGEKVLEKTVSQYFGTGHVIVFVKTSNERDLVIRATHALAEPEKYIDFENEIIKRYKSVGIPSTEIIASDASRTHFPFDYQIMVPLTGKDLEIEWDGSKSQYDKLSLELGRMIARQYQLKGSGWGRLKRDDSNEIIGSKATHNDYLTTYLEHDLAVFNLFDLTSPDGTNDIREYFGSKDLKSLFSDEVNSYFVHHDIADHNIRYSGDRVIALYDWENAIFYDPISDIGSAPTWKTHHPREQLLRQGFLEELGAAPNNFEVKADVYYLRTMIWKIQFALKGKRLSTRHLELFTDALHRNNLFLKLNLDLIT